MTRWIVLLLLCAGTAVRAEAPLPDAKHIRAAIADGRLHQAQKMLGNLSAHGEAGAEQRRLEADLMMAQRRYADAAPLLLALADLSPDDGRLWTTTGIALLRLDRLDEAGPRLTKASRLPGADWRTWNALAAFHDRNRDWPKSEAAYAQAIGLAPRSAAVWNNLGYSLLLQKRVEEARRALEQAVSLKKDDKTIALNLLLARAMDGAFPEPEPSETHRTWAMRLNNAGYAALLAGNREVARSLFARAIEASETHYPAAVANLQLAEQVATQ